MRRILPPPRHLAERFAGGYLVVDQAYNLPERGGDFWYRDPRRACKAAYLLDLSHALRLARPSARTSARQTPAEVA